MAPPKQGHRLGPSQTQEVSRAAYELGARQVVARQSSGFPQSGSLHGQNGSAMTGNLRTLTPMPGQYHMAYHVSVEDPTVVTSAR